MKKFLLLILLLISLPVFAQKIQFADTTNGKIVLREVSWRYPLPVRMLNFSNLLDTNRLPYLDKDNVFTGINIFPKIYVDSFIVRIYALDTGTNITRTILPQTTSIYDLGSSSLFWSNIFTKSIALGIDSTGLIEDSVYVGRHMLLVNCGAGDSNVVWLSDYNVTAGQEYTVKKLDTSVARVIVKSKSGYLIDGATTMTWNAQYQVYTFVYRNKTWYIK